MRRKLANLIAGFDISREITRLETQLSAEQRHNKALLENQADQESRLDQLASKVTSLRTLNKKLEEELTHLREGIRLVGALPTTRSGTMALTMSEHLGKLLTYRADTDVPEDNTTVSAETPR